MNSSIFDLFLIQVGGEIGQGYWELLREYPDFAISSTLPHPYLDLEAIVSGISLKGRVSLEYLSHTG